jgi:hypothetical protein
MTTTEPVRMCDCGYLLLDGQDCPECGKPFSQAGEIIRRSWAHWIVSAISVVLFVVPFGMYYVVGLMNPGHQEAFIKTLIPAAMAWLVSGVFAISGSVMAILVWRKDKGASNVPVTVSLLLTLSILGLMVFVVYAST